MREPRNTPEDFCWRQRARDRLSTSSESPMRNYTLADMNLSRIVARGLVLQVCGERIGSLDEERSKTCVMRREDVISRRGIGRGLSEVFSWPRTVGSKITEQLYIYVKIEEVASIKCIKGRSWKLVEY